MFCFIGITLASNGGYGSFGAPLCGLLRMTEESLGGNIMDCLFCKIVNREIPSNVVYETEDVLAFYDIAPQAPVHVVIIPKQHIASPAHITEENCDIAGKMFLAAAEIAKKLDLENGYRVVSNCGADGGQTVGHLHFHVLAKRNLAWPPG